MSSATLHHICRALDAKNRILGMTLDEAIPMLSLFSLALISNHLLFGLMAMFVIFGLLRVLKKGGEWRLWMRLYRCATRDLASVFLPGTTSPTCRYWTT